MCICGGTRRWRRRWRIAGTHRRIFRCAPFSKKTNTYIHVHTSESELRRSLRVASSKPSIMRASVLCAKRAISQARGVDVWESGLTILFRAFVLCEREARDAAGERVWERKGRISFVMGARVCCCGFLVYCRAGRNHAKSNKYLSRDILKEWILSFGTLIYVVFRVSACFVRFIPIVYSFDEVNILYNFYICLRSVILSSI